MDVKAMPANAQWLADAHHGAVRRLPLRGENQIPRSTPFSILHFPFSNFRSTAAPGFSLVESLVAMSLFLSVLIPLIGLVGNVLILSDSTEIGRALAIAQIEVLEQGDAVETREGFTIERSEGFTSDCRAVTVKVSKNGKQLVVLHRLVRR